MNIAIYLRQSTAPCLLNQLEVFLSMCASYVQIDYIFIYCKPYFSHICVQVYVSPFFLFLPIHLFMKPHRSNSSCSFCEAFLMLLVQKTAIDKPHFCVLFCSLIVSWLYLFYPANLKDFVGRDVLTSCLKKKKSSLPNT